MFVPMHSTKLAARQFLLVSSISLVTL